MHFDYIFSMSMLEIVKLILTVISGLCWTIVYIEGIRIGFRDKSYAIPFYALALNFGWEALYTFFGFRINGINVQNIFNAVWLTFDIGILYTYFKFGQKYFRTGLKDPSAQRDGADKTLFIVWSVLGLVTAFALQYALLKEFGVAKGRRLFGIPAKSPNVRAVHRDAHRTRQSRRAKPVHRYQQMDRDVGAHNSVRSNWRRRISPGKLFDFSRRSFVHHF